MELNDFSQRVKERFLKELPTLSPYVQIQPDGILEIKIPHPLIISGLIISTQGNEISIGCKKWHTHGELLKHEANKYDNGSELDDSIAFVKDILNDKIKFVVSFVDNQFNDAWPTFDEEKEHKFIQLNEKIVINYWSKLE